jgi:MFS family permease
VPQTARWSTLASTRPSEPPLRTHDPTDDTSAAPAADAGVPATERRAERPVPTLAPLRVPAYRRIWGAAVVSHLGTFLQMTAAPWLMLELTGSAFLVSLVTTFLLLPRLLLTLPAGALADVVDRRTLLIVGNLVAAAAVATMAVLAATDVLDATLLLVLTLVLGSGTAVAMPAFQTLVPDLVPRPLLPQAITLNSGAFNVARAVGPAIGGALVAAGLVAASFGANALSFLVVVSVLLTLPRDDVETVVGSRRHLLRATAVGVRYARFTPSIRILLVVTAGFTLTAASVQALLAPAAAELGVGGVGYGVLWGTFGAGALVGVGTRERARIALGERMVPVSIVAFGVGGVTFGLAPSPVLAGFGLAIGGLAWVWTLITLNATVQLLAPTWVRSRVVSLYALVVGVQPVGAFLAGAVAERAGSGVAIAIATGVTLVLGLWALRLELPVLGEVREPRPAGIEAPDAHRDADVSGPVVISTTWHVAPEAVDEFLAVMRQVRRVRRRTGARSWQLHRDALVPERFTEVVRHAAWSEHVAQPSRLETGDLAVLERARSFDVDGAPRTRHLVPVDVAVTRPGRRWRAGHDRRSRARS